MNSSGCKASTNIATPDSFIEGMLLMVFDKIYLECLNRVMNLKE